MAKRRGDRRAAVGDLTKASDGRYIFKYFSSAIELQEKEGFSPYTEFQDLTKEYNGNVIEIFGQRLTKSDRPDISSFYKFWEVDSDKAHDKFYLLGKTQGLVATDNFEFLADYKFVPDLHFLTEIAGLSKLQLPKGTFQIGEELQYELEPDNPKDKLAVKLLQNGKEIGYIKKYHSKVFHDAGTNRLRLTIKAIDQNGIVKRVFVKVSV
ncbi:HIRAN domain-containing protein [Niabella hibiscisoli]|uniref:HIRAN domain-containing protein n=1 Tax=Niabella hibiscisoli TaxID=1825928 RepID=UPI001F0F59BF|nr:HIRAN domain-containing protein [Niabella hibiscisoli]MCH5716108.1 HIRAN domain-containing protein [Niabella hibiscisoli]